jgi:HAE1 family hydrophobic/amphiphilic exporter-1
MTLSLTAVFIPVLFMGGILGRLLHEFAVTIGAAILVSGFVSLTLTPMLCSRFLRPPTAQGHGLMYRALERVFDGALALYSWTLARTLKYRAATLAASLVLLVATVYLFYVIPKGFIPSEDNDQISLSTEAVQGIGFDAMVKHQLEVADVLLQDPNVVGFSNHAGASGPNATMNTGRMFVDLKPRAERALSADEVIEELRPKLARITGIRTYLQNPPAIQIGARQAQGLYQVTLQSTDTEELYHYAPLLQQRMAQIPGLVDVASDLQIKNPQVNIQIDRDKVSATGLTVDQVDTALYSAFGTRQISTIYAPNNQYKVILQVAPQYQHDPSELSALYVRSAGTGTLVPLSAVTTASTDAGPLTVNHTGQLPSVTLSFNLAAGMALGDAVSAVQEATKSVLPDSITTTFQGTAQAFQASLQGLGLILLMAIVVIYIVLGVLYESFIHPLTILSGLPAAGFGALLTLVVFHVDLNLYAFVGVIMLVGLVKKNGIMMIDFALASQRSRRCTPAEAIYEACQVRFRPIMMTTMSALVGTLPIALGVGAGADSRRPLGLAVVGGLLVSQLLTLYITPVYYVYLETARQRLSGRVPAAHAEPEAALGLPIPTE